MRSSNIDNFAQWKASADSAPYGFKELKILFWHWQSNDLDLCWSTSSTKYELHAHCGFWGPIFFTTIIGFE